MNNDYNLKKLDICIAGLNCRAGYATVCSRRAEACNNVVEADDIKHLLHLRVPLSTKEFLVQQDERFWNNATQIFQCYQSKFDKPHTDN